MHRHTSAGSSEPGDVRRGKKTLSPPKNGKIFFAGLSVWWKTPSQRFPTKSKHKPLPCHVYIGNGRRNYAGRKPSASTTAFDQEFCRKREVGSYCFSAISRKLAQSANSTSKTR